LIESFGFNCPLSQLMMGYKAWTKEVLIIVIIDSDSRDQKSSQTNDPVD